MIFNQRLKSFYFGFLGLNVCFFALAKNVSDDLSKLQSLASMEPMGSIDAKDWSFERSSETFFAKAKKHTFKPKNPK